MSLQTKAVLARLTIRQWDGFKKDKRVSDNVDAQYHTKGGAGSYNKRLIHKDTLKPIANCASRMRTMHTDRTTPFAYEGVGVLPNKLILPYSEDFRALDAQFTSACEAFITRYPQYKVNRAVQLGDLFNPDDYPDVDNLRKRFSAKVQFYPVPDQTHFFTEISQDIRDELQNEMADIARDNIQHVYDKVNKVLEHYHERLNDPENIFRDSMIENLAKLIEVLPAMNMFGDEKLTRAHELMSSELLRLDAQSLRVDMPARKQAANTAFDIVNLLKGGEAHATPAPESGPGSQQALQE